MRRVNSSAIRSLFRKGLFLGDKKMQSHTKLSNLFILACLISLTSVGFGQGAEKLSFPYIAEITNDNVNIRSGPGTNYYHCGKLNAGDRVKVVASKYSWSHIVPPEGSFSWISKQYVSVAPDNPNVGTVTGDSVRVYAGSDMLKPIHSTTVQLHLNKNDKVGLMGEEIDDYYKIIPPSGAYLWVLTQYAKPLGPVGDVPLIAEPKAEPETDTAETAATNFFIESEKLKEYYSLTEQIEAERAKPLAQQNYEEVKRRLAEIANNSRAGKAARYAVFSIKQIGLYELAFAVDKAVPYQDSQLQETLKEIEKWRVKALTQVPDLGDFTVIGRLQISKIYGQEEELKHYRITDDSGQTICYALPEGPVSGADLSEFIGRKVGLMGTVEPHPQTKSALLRFTEITELE